MITTHLTNGARLRRWAGTLISSSVLLAAGCGGGGGSRDQTATGIFLDSPVAGVTYTTATLTGTTDAAGTFRYQPGETVSFALGDLALGQSDGAAEITLFDLAGISSPPSNEAELEAQIYRQDQIGPLHRVISTAQILQTLDTDNNPDNGIEIDAAVAALIPAADIDLDAPYWETQVGGNIRDGLGLPGVLRAAATAGLLTERPVRNAALALEHVLDELNIDLGLEAYTTYARDTDADGAMDWIRTLTFSPLGDVVGDIYDTDGDGIAESVYEYVYDDNRHRTRYTRDDDLDGNPEYINTSTYDDFGYLVDNTAMNGDGSGVSSQLLTYDDDGRLTRREVISARTHTIEHWFVDANGLRSTYEVDNDGDGNVDRRSLLAYAQNSNRSDRWVQSDTDNNLDGTVDSRQSRAFDDRGRLLSVRTDADLDGIDEHSRTWTYDGFGIASFDDNRVNNPYRQRWVRNAEGLEIRYEYDGNYDGIYERVVETAYNANGKPTVQTTDLDADGIPDSIRESLYDTNGNLIAGTTDSNADGTPDRIYTYEYDARDRLVRQTYDSNADGLLDEVTEYSNWVQVGLGAWL